MKSLLLASLLSFGVLFNAIAADGLPKIDWLLDASSFKAKIDKSKDGKDLVLNNGLVQRKFRLQPNLACYDFTNLSTGQQLIRAVQPEAKIQINGEWV